MELENLCHTVVPKPGLFTRCAKSQLTHRVEVFVFITWMHTHRCLSETAHRGAKTYNYLYTQFMHIEYADTYLLRDWS